MKKIYKLIASGMFIGFFSIYFSEFANDLQYQKKIPVKYLLDGTYEGNDDTFDYYKLTGKENEVAISLRNDSTSAISIPESYTSNSVTYKVTGIYRNAFSNKSIGSIYIPKTITTIDYEAFMNTEFTSNTKVDIPYSVEQLGTACFFKSNLTDIYFSDSVSQNITSCDITTSDESETTTVSKLEIISDYCFAKCSSLKTVSFSSSLKSIKEHAFEYCSSISTLAFLSGLEYIGTNAFNYCASLKTVYIPSSMVSKTEQSIADFAFMNCNTGLVFNISCTSYSDFDDKNNKWRRKNIFDDKSYECQTQTSDVYANGLWLYEKDSSNNINILKYIGEIDSTGYLAFPNTINNSDVVSFETNCLSGFESQIKYLFFPKGLNKIPESYFTSSFSSLKYVGCVDGDNCYTTPTKDYIIDLSKMSSLTTIGASAFKGDDNFTFRTNVTEIKLPENLQDIGDSAFESYVNCEKISFEDPSKRTNTNSFGIGSYAFNYLGSNKESNEATSDIVFPKQLTNIYNYAFQQAKCIRSLKFLGGSDASSLTFYEGSFYDCSGLKSLIIEDRGGNTTINGLAFAQWNGNYRDFTYKPSLQTVYLPSSISIGGTEPFARQIRCTFYFSGSAPSGFKNDIYYFRNYYYNSNNESLDSDDMTYNNEAFKLGFTYHCGIYENVSLEEVSSSKNYILHTDGSLSYVLNKTDNTAVVSRYHFDMQNETNLTKKEVEVPSSITFNGTDYNVTEIGIGAFGNSDSYDFINKNTSDSTYRTISKIILPNTIKKIGHYAFFRCVGLEEIGYQDSSSKLKMPTTLESIGEMAFALSGIKYIDSLNSNCDFLLYGDTSQLSNQKRSFPSPFLNCPQLEYISLTNKDNSKLKLYNDSSLCDSNDNILVVFPKYSGTNTSFVSKKFYYGAYRCVTWIKDFTISTADFPNSATDLTPQAIFAGYTSQKSIREKCRFKSRSSVSIMDNEVSLDVLKLTYDSTTNTFKVPTNFLYGSKVKKVLIPYGGGNGTFPNNLLEAVSSENNSTIFQVQKNSFTSTDYTNTEETAKFLDLTDCGYTSIGDKAFYQSNLLDTVNLTGITTIGTSSFEGSSIKVVNGFSDVTTINEKAFNNCSSLITVDSFNSTKTIGNSAFNNCSKLTSLNNFGNVETIGDSAFNNCTSLTTVDSFNSTKTIGNSAFNNCSSLTKIKFSNNLTSIGTSAFENCKKVTSTIDDPFIIPNSVTNLGSSCFREMDGLVSVKFESGSTLTEIPNMAFDNCNNLAYITFPDNITTIGSIAFWGCGFKNITIPKTVTTIGSQAFESCGSLESVTFEENEDSSVVLSIGDDAFLNCKNSKFTTLNLTGRTFTIGSNSFGKCSNLTTITIGSGVTKINDSAFSEDTNISTVTFKQGNDVLYLGSYIFDNCKITKLDFSKRAVKIGYIDNSSKKNTFSNCKSLETIIFGDSYAYIGSSSFEGCTKLTNITFGSGVETIIEDAFKGCTSLTTLDFTKCTNLTEINGFENCTSLNSVNVGAVTKIGDNAFNGCTSLKSLDFKSVTSLGTKAFANSGLTSLHITSNLTSMGESCFENCSSLVTAKFDSKGFILSNNAFKNCTNLKSVIFLGTSDSGYGDTPFDGCSSLVLVVLNSGFDKTLNTQIFKGLTNLSTAGNGVVCLSLEYDSTGLGNFTKISDTYQVKIAYSSVPSSGVPSGTYKWEWVDTNKESVKYYVYNSTSTTTVPSSLIKRKAEEASY